MKTAQQLNEEVSQEEARKKREKEVSDAEWEKKRPAYEKEQREELLKEIEEKIENNKKERKVEHHCSYDYRNKRVHDRVASSLRKLGFVVAISDGENRNFNQETGCEEEGYHGWVRFYITW